MTEKKKYRTFAQGLPIGEVHPPHGNLGLVSRAKLGDKFEDGRFLYWTEDSRMHAAADEKFYSYYAYDHDGGLDALHLIIGTDDTLQGKANLLFDQSLAPVNSRVPYENELECILNNGYAKEEFGHWIEGIPRQMKADVKTDYDRFCECVNSMLDDPDNGQEKDVYFYHSDHLGSASWITDNDGVAVQHLQYLPYGERYVDQRVTGYQERFTFTGKERDEETGYGYFGARYMDHELMTMWLSVDPMSDKYPGISPYAYCAWNPVRYIDPDGRSYSEFDENGNYLRTIKDNWWHNTFVGRKGRIVDGDGNVTQSIILPKYRQASK